MSDSAFWAKKKESNGRFLWLPLIQHLEDTGGVSVLLWEHWLSDGQRRFIKDSLSIKSEDVARSLVKFIGMVHDIGKATPVFQTMKGYSNSGELDLLLLEKLERAGFRDITNLILASPKSSRHEITGEYLLSLFGVENDIGSIIGGHHGKTIDSESTYKKQASYEANLYQDEDEGNSTRNLWIRSQKQIFEYALKSCGYKSVEELPKIEQPAQILLLGLLIMADWITSNEEYFPLIDIFEDSVLDKDKRIFNGFLSWKGSDIWCPQRIRNYVDLYKNRFGFETVALLSKLDVDKHINIEIELDELDLTSAESKATYAQIKEYVWNKFELKVPTLYIAQIKRKCGIELREHYNKSKKEKQIIPQCTPEKEEAIMDALRYFKMVE
ncbi:hypothetical protein HMPREF1639_07645 [Peptostreptococcus sp. MV1]|nr:CRISPR-associated endonuclease Cas3'' [Peptostreptococcus sp. MV1]KGF11167.1 hypothetical protein HMPREF1639_07645 [Peptostreptococcus sp. MV1]